MKISDLLSYQALLSKPCKHPLWLFNQVFLGLFPKLRCSKMSPLSSLIFGGWNYFHVPKQTQEEENGAKCIVCTAQVVNGPRTKFTSPQPGWWASPVLTPCETNSAMLKNRHNMWKAGEWSQSQLVPNSWLWLLLAVWPLTKNLTFISLSFLIWKMGRITPILKRHQRNSSFPFYLFSHNFCPFWTRGIFLTQRKKTH